MTMVPSTTGAGHKNVTPLRLTTSKSLGGVNGGLFSRSRKEDPEFFWPLVQLFQFF